MDRGAATPTLLSLDECEAFEAEVLYALEMVYGMEVTKTHRGGLTAGGLPGTISEYEVASPEMMLKIRGATLMSDGVIYTIGLVASEEEYGAAISHFESVLASFEIIPEGAPAHPEVWTDMPGMVLREDSTICGSTAGCLTGQVNRVVDGDTLEIDGVMVRLALVNAPEMDTAEGVAAAAFARSVCPAGSLAVLDEDDGQREGSYGRMIAEVWCGGRSLNGELVAAGHGDVLTFYCPASEFLARWWAAACHG